MNHNFLLIFANQMMLSNDQLRYSTTPISLSALTERLSQAVGIGNNGSIITAMFSSSSPNALCNSSQSVNSELIQPTIAFKRQSLKRPMVHFIIYVLI